MTYVPFVAVQYIEHFTATPQLVPYLKDRSENRRLGTLLVFVDGGIAADTPLIALPINLASLLELPQVHSRGWHAAKQSSRPEACARREP